jgi:uncharacterized membrane protein
MTDFQIVAWTLVLILGILATVFEERKPGPHPAPVPKEEDPFRW